MSPVEIFAVLLAVCTSMFVGYKIGIKKATKEYSQQIRDILVAALSADFLEGFDGKDE